MGQVGGVEKGSLTLLSPDGEQQVERLDALVADQGGGVGHPAPQDVLGLVEAEGLLGAQEPQLGTAPVFFKAAFEGVPADFGRPRRGRRRLLMQLYAERARGVGRQLEVRVGPLEPGQQRGRGLLAVDVEAREREFEHGLRRQTS